MWPRKCVYFHSDTYLNADCFFEKKTADQADPVFEKFIAATHLHKDLKRRYLDNSTSLRFYGTYAIIAFPDIDNKKRARQVASDLRDNTSLHFKCVFLCTRRL